MTQPLAPEPPTPEPPDHEQVIGQIETYLRENGQRYTLDALRAQLQASGQSPDLIEVAVARYQASSRKPSVWLYILGWTGIIVLLSVLGGIVLSLGNTFDWFNVGIWSAMGLVGFSFLGLFVGLILFVAGWKQLGKGLMIASLIIGTILTIIFVLFFGYCLYIISNI
jgi:hypothetical protein